MFNSFLLNNKEETPQYVHFRCSVTHLSFSLKQIGETFKAQKELSKTVMNHDEVYSGTWRDKRSEWLDYVKNDLLCTAFSYARYTKAMKEKTGFRMKQFLSLPGLGWINFNSLRTEHDGRIYTYNDKYMNWFLRQSLKGVQVCAFN